MSISLYMDVHVHSGITRGLRRRAVDILTAQEDGTSTLPDPELLDRAATLGRVLFTHDEDFLQEASHRQQTGEPFTGVIFERQSRLVIGRCIDDLELIAKLNHPVDLMNQVMYLPL